MLRKISYIFISKEINRKNMKYFSGCYEAINITYGLFMALKFWEDIVY